MVGKVPTIVDEPNNNSWFLFSGLIFLSAILASNLFPISEIRYLVDPKHMPEAITMSSRYIPPTNVSWLMICPICPACFVPKIKQFIGATVELENPPSMASFPPLTESMHPGSPQRPASRVHRDVSTSPTKDPKPREVMVTKLFCQNRGYYRKTSYIASWGHQNSYTTRLLEPHGISWLGRMVVDFSAIQQFHDCTRMEFRVAASFFRSRRHALFFSRLFWGLKLRERHSRRCEHPSCNDGGKKVRLPR